MDMENDPSVEPEGGPRADYYGGTLNGLDKAIAIKKGETKDVPYDVAITKLKKDPNDAYGLHHITQAEGMLQAALTPGMTERNPWLLGITKKTGSDKWKSETEAQALSLIKAFKKAQGHSSKDIQIHIDNLKKKYTK